MESNAITIRTFADAEAHLASNLPGYQSRRPQQIGAEAVEKAFQTGEHALIQAGCGVGKSFMTLIPAILSGKRTMVATATKALQSQLVDKDLPFLTEHLGVDFSWAMLQGRSNYFCKQRALVVAGEEPLVADMISEASEPGFEGLRSSFSFEVPMALWAKVRGDTDECSDMGCSKEPGLGCFAADARRRAQDVDLVVINHSLLCMDLTLRGDEGDSTGFGMLGEYANVVIDEVHNLENYCKGALGYEFTEGAILGPLAELRNFVNRNMTSEVAERVLGVISEVNSAKSLLWMSLAGLMEEGSQNLRIQPSTFDASESEWEGMAKALWDLVRVADTVLNPSEAKINKRWQIIKSKLRRLAAKFARIITDGFDETVRWVSTKVNARRERQFVINSQPLFVDQFLSDRLFSQKTVVMCSATAKVGGSFDFIAKKLGLVNHPHSTVDVGTMFNFASQGRFFAPRSFPEPTGRTKTQWEAVAPNAMLELVRASGGGALLLFTSVSAMKRAYEVIEPQVPYKCFMQGQMEVPALSKAFKDDTHSVLFATRSFMEGIDVQGESLRLVVLDKLIFQVPNDPVVEATHEYIERRGGNAFREMDLPEMMLVLEQAAGRLIRTVTDTGVFALLDSRVWTKPYGGKVRAALPPFTQVDSLEAVEAFYGA